MKLFKKILYVAESSVPQESCLARAVSLAQNNQASLTVIDVMPPVTTGIDLSPGGPISSRLQPALVEEHRKAMQSLTEKHRQELDIQVEVAVGIEFLEVIYAVLRNGYDLVIKAAENPSWIDRLFGSNDMHLLRKCPCPVWLMKSGEKTNYECIVAAIDYDPVDPGKLEAGLNQQILELSTSLALSDFAELHLVHAWDVPEAEFVRLWVDKPDESVDSLIEGEKQRQQNGMSGIQDKLQAMLGQESYDHLAPRAHLVKGNPSEAIPKLASQLNADLVVMGTIMRTGIPGLIIGNTSEAILDQLKCSVLAVKPPGFVSPVTV